MGDSEDQPGIVPADEVPEGRQRRSMPPRTLVVSIGIVAVVAVATVVGVTVAGRGGSHASPGGASVTTGTIVSAPTGPKVSMLDAKLWATAELAGIGNGDPHPYDLWAVGPLPLGRSLALMHADGSEDVSIPVYVVEIRGAFVCGGCSGSKDARAPRGDVITDWLLASNLSVEGFSLGRHWISLTAAPKAFRLLAPPGDVVPLDARPRLSSNFAGTWSNREGIADIATSGGTVRWGGTQCTSLSTEVSSCRTIEFRSTGVAIGASKPYLRLVAAVERDDAGLAVGTPITFSIGETPAELVIAVAGNPAPSIPNPWT